MYILYIIRRHFATPPQLCCSRSDFPQCFHIYAFQTVVCDVLIVVPSKFQHGPSSQYAPNCFREPVSFPSFWLHFVIVNIWTCNSELSQGPTLQRSETKDLPFEFNDQSKFALITNQIKVCNEPFSKFNSYLWNISTVPSFGLDAREHRKNRAFSPVYARACVCVCEKRISTATIELSLRLSRRFWWKIANWCD